MAFYLQLTELLATVVPCATKNEAVPEENVPTPPRLFTYRTVTSEEEKPSHLTKLCIRS